MPKGSNQFFTGHSYSQWDSKHLIGGVGNWAHGPIKLRIVNLPANYDVYIQFQVYAFYDFDATNNEGFTLLVNGYDLATESFVNSAPSTTPLSKTICLSSYDIS